MDVTTDVSNGWVGGGFAIPNDGYPIPTSSNPDHSTYPEDNNSCGTGFDSVTIAATYNPIAPDTPLNCSAVIDCENFTVTCDASPDTFEVHQADNGRDTIVGTSPGSLTPGTVTISGMENVVGVPLTVCTTTERASIYVPKLTACTGPLPVTSATACGGSSSGGPHFCPVGTHLCHGACVPGTGACL
jgi:hypothetical protein